ncbi:SGNH/GDSL hydrolase family protein [Streptomyces sp. NPDC059740]|uniref:SGNH/GDSL hydrolase family protein n=1 Tax=Streptomyces sp. NPDC059740 TaxID=3346926 RepID=UPI00365C48F3
MSRSDSAPASQRTAPTAPLRRLAAGTAAAALLATGASPASAAPAETGPRTWVAGWAASPQPPSTGFTPNWSQEGFSRQTLRQVVHVTATGDRARIRLSNVYGLSALHLTGATLALSAGGAAVVPGTVRHLTFHGAAGTVLPAGRTAASDPAPLDLTAPRSVTVTLYLAGTTGPATFHAQALADTYRAEGDHRGDMRGEAFGQTTQSWYYLSGVDVTGGSTDRRGVAVFGDSITDGFASTPNTDHRYSDRLAARTHRPVVNAGIGGNLLLNDSAWYGPRGTGRFARDVLQQPGTGTAVVLEGVNDIGFSETADQPTYKPDTPVSAASLEAGYRHLIERAHAAGVKVVGATLLPFGTSDHWGPHARRVSAEVNHWIRTSGAFDAVVDLHHTFADPSDPDRLAPRYDSGDGLHPNDEGYDVLAREVAAVLDREGL